MQTPSPHNDSLKMSICYDDTCSLCSHIVGKIKNTPQGRFFKFIGVYENREKLPVNFKQAEVERDVHFIDPAGEIYKGADAILKILNHYPYLKYFARVFGLPGIKFLFKKIYRLIADNRHKFKV